MTRIRGCKGLALLVSKDNEKITDVELRRTMQRDVAASENINANLERIASVLERLERFFVATSVQDVEDAIAKLEKEGFLPKILFAKDESFEYAEKIENLIKQINK